MKIEFNPSQMAIAHATTITTLLGDLTTVKNPSGTMIAEQAKKTGLPHGIFVGYLRKIQTSGLNSIVPDWDWDQVSPDELEKIASRYFPIARVLASCDSFPTQVERLKEELGTSTSFANDILQRYFAFGAYGMKTLDPNAAAEAEMERRLKLLGNLKNLEPPGEYSDIGKKDISKHINARARKTFVGYTDMMKWWIDFHNGGEEGLKPNLNKLSYQAESAMLLRVAEIGEFLDAEFIGQVDIDELAARNDWSLSKAKKWLKRARNGGKWGLAPENNPHKSGKKEQKYAALGTLTPTQLKVAEERFALISDLLLKDKISEEDVNKRAAETKCSRSTLWDYIKRCRDAEKANESKIAAVADKTRFDKVGAHVSDRMKYIVEALFLTNYGSTIEEVRKGANKRAIFYGEVPPSDTQVRSIIAAIPEPVKAIAHEGTKKGRFPNSFLVTFPINFDILGFIIQIDWTQAPNFLIDERKVEFHNKDGTFRPYIINAYVPVYEILLAHRITYGRPDKYDIAKVTRDALIFAGLPNEVWVDNGWELVAELMQTAAIDIGFKLHPGRNYHPQTRGAVESTFKILLKQFFSNEDLKESFVGFDPVQRNPNAKAIYNIYQYEEKYIAYWNDRHNAPYMETGLSRIDNWRQNVFNERIPEELLDILVLDKHERTVQKDGINFNNRTYQDPTGELSKFVGNRVIIRAESKDMNPDSIIVFQGKKRICVAYATDTPFITNLSPQEKYQLQKSQIKHFKEKIDSVVTVLEEVDAEMNAHNAAQDYEKAKKEKAAGPKRSNSKSKAKLQRKSPKGDRNKAFDRLNKDKIEATDNE